MEKISEYIFVSVLFCWIIFSAAINHYYANVKDTNDEDEMECLPLVSFISIHHHTSARNTSSEQGYNKPRCAACHPARPE